MEIQSVPFYETQSKGFSCGICMEDVTEDPSPFVAHDADTSDPAKKVQHVFHKKCIRTACESEFLNRNQMVSNCPKCFKPIDLKSLFSADEIRKIERNNNERREHFRKRGEKLKNYHNRVIVVSTIVAILFMNLLEYPIHKYSEGFGNYSLVMKVALHTLGSGFIGRGVNTGINALRGTCRLFHFPKCAELNASFYGGMLCLLKSLDRFSLKPYQISPIPTAYDIAIYFLSTLFLPGKIEKIEVWGNGERGRNTVGYLPLHYIPPFAAICISAVGGN